MPVIRFRPPQIATFIILADMILVAIAVSAQSKSTTAIAGANYDGMYAFVREGEFVQITVESEGRVTGFVSRYGDSESDRGVFLDHFFKSGKLNGNQLTFTTDTVHGVSFEFHGTVERGEGKNRADEAYYVLKGTLIENTNDKSKKTSSRSREVALQSFPQDLSPPPAKNWSGVFSLASPVDGNFQLRRGRYASAEISATGT